MFWFKIDTIPNTGELMQIFSI